MASGNKSGCGIGWASDNQCQWFICGKLLERWLKNLPECSAVLGDKWEVAIKVAVELVGPVVARVDGTSVTNWWWWVVLGDKWQ
jgi:hypothetical protein